MNNNLALFNLILSKYRRFAYIHYEPDNNEFYSYIMAREIVLPQRAFSHPTDWDVFAFLHEIGHVMTNTPKMKRCQQEFLATQWAINEAKMIGFIIPEKFISTYQNYIWNWRESAIKRRAKSIQTKEELTLKY